MVRIYICFRSVSTVNVMSPSLNGEQLVKAVRYTFGELDIAMRSTDYCNHGRICLAFHRSVARQHGLGVAEA